MSESAAPLEWVQGRSYVPWLLGFLLVFFSSLVVSWLGLAWGLSWAGIQLTSPRLTLIVNLATLGVAAGPVSIWASQVTIPAPRLGLSPQGVILDHGLSWNSFPWSRAVLRGDCLEVFSPRLGVRHSYALTPYQASRVAFVGRASP